MSRLRKQKSEPRCRKKPKERRFVNRRLRWWAIQNRPSLVGGKASSSLSVGRWNVDVVDVGRSDAALSGTLRRWALDVGRVRLASIGQLARPSFAEEGSLSAMNASPRLIALAVPPLRPASARPRTANRSTASATNHSCSRSWHSVRRHARRAQRHYRCHRCRDRLHHAHQRRRKTRGRQGSRPHRRHGHSPAWSRLI